MPKASSTSPLLQNVILVVATVALTTFASWFVFSPAGSPAPASHAIEIAQLPSGPESRPADEGSTAEHELGAVRSRLAALERELRDRDPTGGEPSVAEAPPPSREERRQEALALRESRRRALTERATSATDDPVWTGQVEESIGGGLSTFTEWIEIRSVRCGTEVCTITMTHAGDRTHVDLLETLRDQPGFGGGWNMYRDEVAGGGYQTTLIMARPGSTLPDA